MKATHTEAIQLMLSKREAAALAKLLGKHSPKSKAELGLTVSEAEIISEIWCELVNLVEANVERTK